MDDSSSDLWKNKGNGQYVIWLIVAKALLSNCKSVLFQWLNSSQHYLYGPLKQLQLPQSAAHNNKIKWYKDKKTV